MGVYSKNVYFGVAASLYEDTAILIQKHPEIMKYQTSSIPDFRC